MLQFFAIHHQHHALAVNIRELRGDNIEKYFPHLCPPDYLSSSGNSGRDNLKDKKELLSLRHHVINN